VNLLIFEVTSFSYSYEILYPKYVKAFTCSNVVFTYYNFILTGICPLDFNGDILV